MQNESAAPAGALTVRGLKAGYGRIEVLHGIDLDLPRGQLVALVGANGAGKTTLLRALSGLVPTRAGRVELLGRDISRDPPDSRVRAGLAQVLEGRQVFGPLSVEDNLLLGGYVRARQARERMDEMFALFPVLAEKRALAAGTLSGGQQQMLAIARALMSRPRVLLLDEPSMGLAPLLVREVLDVVARLRDLDMPVLLVEQNARAALALADHAYVLEVGRITVSGSGQALLRDPRVMAAYLGL
ncbi:ABC transporter ATP-binding protein [Bordetella hinzii]|uniref:ABC transporter ATP-binding protein n=1 Tax=Bordetella hinzii TaxID=103855 RepID=A0AAN1RWW6_9BORD|nr:ABC transporter ATP-binding protein [Bordetella hinzii]AKQ57015.1 High-affinity branched-chain amino acid transport ATP-binding protein LivF [Bordetella hinzii]AKQ61481.1 High-affinity branched-chain amino acid transport ATP-binding protein LivF [Bordetella hinzii]AZW17552.1 ABC transporter ATP-binding protein [Bordetella hinzii]KCB27271.1 ABC transporter, ATP-binding protein [Bordetella hinzii L60]KCB28721.1 ABC transporter, ATP-binding protein [Bordetella hinzii CA90 BAL1384]